jgi:DNA-binding transcriptional LysR family regulator
MFLTIGIKVCDMPRNLDMTALRSFVAVADAGGVTRAASLLNLTQSAVSMQLKRLEEATGINLIDRSSRTASLTAAGEQLLGYARRMLELNDEVYARMTHQAYEGEVVLGVPHDIVYPAVPRVLRRFATDYPRMRVNLVSSMTQRLLRLFSRGECDMIVTTEDGCGDGGETLVELPLVWVGAQGGTAWRHQPLRLAFEKGCIFRHGVLESLEDAGIAWEMAVESDSTRTVEATVSADLAVNIVMEGMEAPLVERIQHGGALPELAKKKINLYVSELATGRPELDLADLIRQAYRRE